MISLFFCHPSRRKRESKYRLGGTANQKSEEEKEEETQRRGEAQASKDVPPLLPNRLRWSSSPTTFFYSSQLSLIRGAN